MWYLIYKLEHPWIEQYKVYPDRPWPWKENPEAWKKLFRKAVKTTFINVIIMTFACHFFSIYVLHGGKMYLNMDPDNMPSFSKVFKQLIILVIMEDFCFHMMHRLFHTKWKYLPLYQLFHKKHHEFIQTVSIAFVYVHPIEYIFCNHY